MAIRRFRIQDVEPGMILAKPAVNHAGRVVLTEGTALSERLIDRLQNWDIFVVDIASDEKDSLLEQFPALPEAFESRAVSEMQKRFHATHKETVREVQAAFDQIRYYKAVPLVKIREIANKSFQEFSVVPGAINLLYMLEGMDDRTMRHSLNVAIVAGVLGRWLGLSTKIMQDLMLSALLHDVGKTQIPLEVINKKTVALTTSEEKMLKNHPLEGYQLLNRSAYQLPFSVLAGVLQHHEGANGTGYPLQLTGEKIHIFARIIAVADIYDTMTSKHSENRMTPFLAVETMIHHTFEKLDPAIAGVFLNNIRDQFIGNVVRLSDGRSAVVVYLGRFVSERPVVQTMDGQFIDLERIRGLNIVEVIRV